MCKRRVNPAGFWHKWLSPQSARTRKNPQEPARTRKNPRKHAAVGKKTNPEGLVFPLLVVGL